MSYGAGTKARAAHKYLLIYLHEYAPKKDHSLNVATGKCTSASMLLILKEDQDPLHLPHLTWRGQRGSKSTSPHTCEQITRVIRLRPPARFFFRQEGGRRGSEGQQGNGFLVTRLLY